MLLLASASLGAWLNACASDDDPILMIERAGGDTTTLNRSAGAFEASAPNLSRDDRTRHLLGDAAFEALFQPPPATVNAGLGPQFNHVSCASCHIRNGRGSPTALPESEGSMLLVRVSQAGRDPETGGPLALPDFGDQLQDHAIMGVLPEASIEVTWLEVPGRYADGERYLLRRPRFDIRLANGRSLSSGVMTSPRIPPPVFGLGLLEAVSDDEILAFADPNDRDGDGISGRANQVWDVAQGRRTLGRFGWKANTPHLRQQAAGAYSADMGVSSPLLPEADGHTDIDQATLEATTFYTQTLAVPARAALEDSSARGARLFHQIGCATCHRSVMQTGLSDIAALAQQTIAPYTDLLLHDLGEELADHRPDFDASGTEWRTPPLWGIGLTTKILGEGAFLHDGRARNLEEAILWHGGEGEASRNAFKMSSKKDRQALVAFLNAL